jgi:hypothetical protein
MAGDEILYFLAKYNNHGLVVNPLLPRTKKAYLNDWQLLPREALISEAGEAMARWGEINLGIRLDGLTVLDIERPELWFLFFTEAPEVVGQYTWVCRTGSGGYHVYFLGEMDIKGCKADEFAELLSSSKHYVVAPPSIHPDTGRRYEWVSDIEKVAVGDVSESGLLRLKQKIGALKKYSALIEALVGVWRPEHRHELSLGLSGVLRKTGVSFEDAEIIIKTVALLARDPEVDDRLRALRDTYEKPLSEVAAWSKLKQELVSIVGEEKAEQFLGLLPNSRAERGEGERRRSVLSLVIPDGPIVFEAIGVPNGLGEYDPKLLVYGPDGYRVVDSYRIGGDTITARPPRSYPYKPYVIENLEAKSRLELIDLIHREVERFIDAEPEEKATFTAFILLSYVQEFFDALPYLYLVGDNESGKSHLLNLMAELCYRPLAGVSHTAADLYSYLEDDGLPLTIIEDEYQGSEKDTEKMKVYKSGYKKGARVARVVTYEGGRRVDYFNSYGLKIVAAEKLIENKGFMQRCIVIEMVEGYPEKDHYDAEDYARFAWLRSELLKWRMRVLASHESLPKVEADWLRGRDRELYLPLLVILHGSPIYPILERFLRERAEERKREREGSLEATICRAVVTLLSDGSSEIDFTELWLEVKNEVGGVEELDKNNVARSMYSDLHGTISKKDVASILSAKLGMKKRRTTKNGLTRTIYIPEWGKLVRALRKYGLNALMPKMPNSLETPTLENPSKTAPEAEKTPLPNETPQG